MSDRKSWGEILRKHVPAVIECIADVIEKVTEPDEPETEQLTADALAKAEANIMNGGGTDKPQGV